MDLPRVLESQEPCASSSSSPSSAARCRLGLVVAVACCSLAASLAALAVTLAKHQQQPLPKLPTYPPQNSAQLVLNLNGNPSVNQRELDWFDSASVKGVYLSSAFEYSSPTLMVKVPGWYCIYAQLSVKRLLSDFAEQADASLIIHHTNTTSSSPRQVLTIPLNLSSSSSETVQMFRVVSSRLESNDKLHVTLTASPNAEHYWSLPELGNFFGLFQILET